MILGDGAKAFNPRLKFGLDETNTSWNSANASASGDAKTVFAIQMLSETTFDTLVDSTYTTTPNSTNTGAALTALTYPAGFVLYGKFKSIEVATGEIICSVEELK